MEHSISRQATPALLRSSIRPSAARLPEAAGDGAFLADVEGPDAADDADVIAIAQALAGLDQGHVDLGIGEGRMFGREVALGRAVAPNRGDGHDQIAGLYLRPQGPTRSDSNDRLAADGRELVGGDLQARGADPARDRPDRDALVGAPSRAVLAVEGQLLAVVPGGLHLLDAAGIAGHQHGLGDLPG